MHLKRVSIWGFKSFAARTNIEFCSGLSVIVGSNGSGKSNIADAIWWGLGQQNPRLLRASKAEQLIFSGSTTRSPLSVAEVAIVLQDEGCEVGFLRRVSRDGENEYYVNGKRCRLKDFMYAVSNCRIHPDSLVVISQGRTDEFLSMSPQERRQLLEQMAGLAKYRMRRDEALRQLADAEAKLVRVLDLRAELEARRAQLAQAAEVARRYREMKSRLAMLEAGATLDELCVAREEMEKAKETAVRVREKMAGLEAELGQQEAALQAAESRKQETQARLEQLNGELTASEQRLASIRTEAVLAEQRLLATAGEIQRLEREVSSEEEAAARLYEEVASGESKVSLLLRNADGKRVEADVLENQEIPRLLDLQRQKAEELEQKRNELFELLNRRASVRNSVITAERELERNAKQVARMCQELEGLAQRKRVLQTRLDALEKQLAEMSGIADTCQKEYDRASQEAALLEKRVGELERQRAVLVSEVARLKSRLSVLQGLVHSLEDFSPGTRAVLRAVADGTLTGIHGALAQLVQVEEGFETAVDVALGAALQFVVTEDVSAAEAAIELLKKTNAGRCTFLPKDTVKGFSFTNRELAAIARYPGVRPLIDVIQVPKEFLVCLQHVAGRVAVAPGLDTALALGRETGFSFKIVTVQGELFNPGGSLSGGRARDYGMTQRRAEIRNIQRELEHKQSELALIESTLADLRQRGRAALEAKGRLAEEIAGARLRLASLQAELHETRRAIQDTDQRSMDLAAEVERLRSEDEKLRESLNALREDLKSTEAAENELRSAIADLEKQHSSAQHLVQEAAAKLAAARAEVASIQHQAEILSERFASLAQQAAALQESSAKKREKVNALSLERAKLEALLQRLRGEQSAVEAQKQDLAAEAQTLAVSLRDLEEEIGRINRACKALRAAQARLASALGEAEVVLKQREMEVELLEEKLSGLPSGAERVPRQLVADEMARLQQGIAEMGEVNLLAEREFEELCRRIDDLDRQIDDINCSKADLYRVLGRVDAEMDKRYLETFETIRQEFRKTFVELFEGGQADLISTAEGVELSVVPPGRKIREMASLSGGEKAMTGIAALFAMARVNPSPFYVLDEVDAALDDVNLAKFLRYLSNASRHTQFIVITHQKPLMEAADALYGVTAEEPGVSRLVSVRLKEA